MKLFRRPTACLLMLLMLLVVCLLPACNTLTTYDPLTGKVLSKATVPDKDFTAALGSAAGLAAKQAAAAYIATHQPASATTLPPVILASGK